jgi:ribonuclease HII
VTAPQIVIGMSQAGRGALAGPLVVTAAAFRFGEPPVQARYQSLRGEQRLSAADPRSFADPVQRGVLDVAIRDAALAVAIVERGAKEIDARLMRSIFPETMKLAVSRVLEELVAKGMGQTPTDYLVLVDGDVELPEGIPCPVRAVVDGERQVGPIGAASIVAKVHRDAHMDALHAQYPDWRFDQHKGYPTAAHKQLLRTHGPSSVHRKSFRPVAEANGLPPGFEV